MIHIGPLAVKEPRNFGRLGAPMEIQKKKADPPHASTTATRAASEATKKKSTRSESAKKESPKRESSKKDSAKKKSHLGTGTKSRTGAGRSTRIVDMQAEIDRITNLDPRERHLQGPLYRSINGSLWDPSEILRDMNDFFFAPGLQMPFPVNDCMPLAMNQIFRHAIFVKRE
jgi:hypothetical protein